MKYLEAKQFKMKLSLLFLGIFMALVTFGQTVPIGQYSGFERIDPRLKYSPLFNELAKDQEEQWYEKVTILISDTNINITKVPVYFKSKKMYYSDSIGGFFTYIDRLKNLEYGKWITIHVSSCQYCRDHSSDAIPMFTYASYRFFYHKKGLLVDYDDEKNILFIKE